MTEALNRTIVLKVDSHPSPTFAEAMPHQLQTAAAKNNSSADSCRVHHLPIFIAFLSCSVLSTQRTASPPPRTTSSNPSGLVRYCLVWDIFARRDVLR